MPGGCAAAVCWLGLVESDAWHGEWKWIKGHKPLGTKDAGPLLTRVDVGRVMTWYEYRTRAEQEGGRLPTATELKLDGISFHDDQWTPIIPSAIDKQTGRKDGQRSTVENAWANIGPRKYQIEFPSWGLDTDYHGFRSLTYFYVRKHSRVLTDSEGMTPTYTNWNLEYKQPNNYYQEELFAIMHASGECPRSH